MKEAWRGRCVLRRIHSKEAYQRMDKEFDDSSMMGGQSSVREEMVERV